MRRPSLRWMLLITVIGSITIAFAGFAVYIDGVERDNRIADIDDELLRAELAGPARPRAAAPGTEPADAAAIQTDLGTVDPPVQLLLSSDGAVIAEGAAANPFDSGTLGELAARDGTRTVRDVNFRVRVTRTPEGAIAVTALPLDEFQDAVSRFRAALALGGGVILVLVAAVLWFLTGYLARPVTRMAHTANLIADGHLDTAVDPPSGSRETAQLSVDLDRMLARLRAALDDANQARDSMGRFLADMAHEIRTPLTALKGYSDLYAKGMLEDTSDVDRAMSRIGSESERLANLANAMLQLASDGQEGHEAEMFDLVGVAEEVASDLRAAYPDQRLDLQIDSGGSHDVQGVRAKVHQAILNLGSNACHQNPPGEPIVIVVQSNAAAVSVGVIDRGPGIDPDDIERIFLPFYRSDNARHRDGQHGAGLGLALTKQIADQHQGTLTAEPTPGGGATFILSLPRPAVGRR